MKTSKLLIPLLLCSSYCFQLDDEFPEVKKLQQGMPKDAASFIK
jgi:hypothetical protein